MQKCVEIGIPCSHCGSTVIRKHVGINVDYHALSDYGMIPVLRSLGTRAILY